MRRNLAILLLVFGGCTTQPPNPPAPPVQIGVDDRDGYHAEVWKRSDGTRYLRYQTHDGAWHEVDEAK